MYASQMREDLELSCMEAAELVFTTLSSTGRQVFSRYVTGISLILICHHCWSEAQTCAVHSYLTKCSAGMMGACVAANPVVVSMCLLLFFSGQLDQCEADDGLSDVLRSPASGLVMCCIRTVVIMCVEVYALYNPCRL
jgi:hypothetical protein